MMDEWGKMKTMCLQELSRRDVTIPARWKTASVYDALVQDGAASLLANTNPLTKAYKITGQGRARLEEIDDGRH